MEKSEKFGFNLLSSNSDDIADINQISDNFRIIDNKALTNEELQSILLKELENKMDKFGSVFFLANEKDPSKIDKTYLGIDSPELILSQIVEESGEDTSVILKGVSTPSNASADTVANKGYVDEALKNINIPETDVSNKVNKVIQNSNSGTSISITVPQLKKNKTIGFIGTFESSVSPNLLNLEAIADGKYLSTAGMLYDNANYITTDFIPIKAGDVIRHQFDLNGNRYDNEGRETWCNMAMLAFYDENKNYIQDSYVEKKGAYTCPANSKYVRISFTKSHLSGSYSNNAIIISDSADVIPFYPYGASTPFESLYIYQGKGTGFTECYCVIDDTNLKVYRNGSTTASFEVAHGLTITNYISIVISTTNNNKTIFYLSSNGESFTSAETVWNSSRNQITVEHSLTSCANVLTFGSKDFGERVWLYGDSYFDHWLPNLINRGYTAFLDDGFSGASSSYGTSSFENALQMGTPSKVIWCLGMNDADTDSNINGSWLKNITTVKNICDLKGIELIVCTIPNVPERNHIYKNAYIRNNFNYIDVAKLVGSDESTSWYSGLLSTDNVHPSTAGDFYIANIMQSYLPDLRNS